MRYLYVGLFKWEQLHHLGKLTNSEVLAAWSKDETGVGASIDPGNQECKPSTDDLAPAPINKNKQIIVINCGLMLGAKLKITS